MLDHIIVTKKAFLSLKA
ncbi:hypothetical protein L6261_01925 [Candidatus Parcubacteria bacterium]|nr:hypothetical protein [Candidatus Parcubacteria bacterium]